MCFLEFLSRPFFSFQVIPAYFIFFRNEETNHATWKLNDISEVSENGTHGSIRAKFTVAKGRSNPSTTAIQFISEGATLSGVEFELVGQGYRISLAKKRFGTGKKYSLYLKEPLSQG